MSSDDDEVLEGVTADDPAPDEENEADAALSGQLGELLSRLEEDADQVDDIVEEASSIIVEGTAAGGSVVVNISGALEAVAVQIDPALVDPSDIGMLEDAVLAALRDALSQVRALQQELAADLEETEIDLSTLLGNLGNLANLGGLAIPDLGNPANPEDLIAGLSGALGNLANPEDLIAGLSGALGNLAGGSGVGGLGGLSGLFGGLGPGSSQAGTDEGQRAAGAGTDESQSAAGAGTDEGQSAAGAGGTDITRKQSSDDEAATGDS